MFLVKLLTQPNHQEEFNAIKDNSVLLLDNGEDINFWNDRWCNEPLLDTLNIPSFIG